VSSIRRIAFFNPSAQLGGAERVLLDWLCWLRKNQSEVLILLVVTEEGPLVERARSLGCEVRVAEIPKRLQGLGDSFGLRFSRLLNPGIIWELLTYTLKLKHIFRSWLPEILHTNGIKAHLLSVWIVPKNCKIIWWIHDLVSQRKTASRIMRVCSTRVSCAVGISDLVSQDCRQAGLRCRIQTVRNSVDLSRFMPRPRKNGFFERFGIKVPEPDQKLRIGLVATYARWKGHDLFIEAVSKLSEQCREGARFFIVGGPAYATAGSQFSQMELIGLAQKFEIADKMVWVPFVENIEDVFNQLDVVIHSSCRPEPFGLTIAEALASGCVVIASRDTGALERLALVKGSMGSPAFLIEPMNAKNLASAMARVIEDEEFRGGLKRNARLFAEGEFNAESVKRRLFDIYQEVVSKT